MRPLGQWHVRACPVCGRIRIRGGSCIGPEDVPHQRSALVRVDVVPAADLADIERAAEAIYVAQRIQRCKVGEPWESWQHYAMAVPVFADQIREQARAALALPRTDAPNTNEENR